MRTRYLRVIALHNAAWPERDVECARDERSRLARHDSPAGPDHTDACGDYGADLSTRDHARAHGEPRNHASSNSNRPADCSANTGTDSGAHSSADGGAHAAAD